MAQAKTKRQPEQKLPPLRPGDKAPTPRPRDEGSPESESLMTISGIVPKRPKVTLELPDQGPRVFELALMSEMPIARQQKMVRLGNEYDKLFEADLDEIEDEVEREATKARLKDLLDAQFDEVLLAPQTVKKACNDFVRSQVVRAFTLAPLQMMLTEQAKRSEERQNGSSESSTS